ncbi:MAG: FAD-binding oxidoreductase [Bacteroidales bacterium]|nr:FAD-binding oxidoreductase [Bacteroidales bacterium]
MNAQYTSFLDSIGSFIPKDRIYTDSLRRLAWGTDAGFYRETPQIVIRSSSEEEVSRILKEASARHLPVTFRAAGTSLSGQSISESILVVAGKNWEKYTVHAEGESITLQPGIVGAQVNKILAPYGRKFGPDPASIGSCMVGGIVMNNASGMCCGIHANSDRMMTSCRIVFADGTVLDTADKASREAFAQSHGKLIDEIVKLRDEVLADKALLDRINYKYSIKNVTGLNLLPLVRFSDPFDIIAHLMVGSEGTLGFMSEVTMDTLPVAPFKASAMIYFSDIKEAARAVVAMRPLGVAAAELLDWRSLASVHDTTGEGLTAVLTEVQAQSASELEQKVAEVVEAVKPFNTFIPVRFTSDPAETSKYWAIRSGIFPTVGGMRKQGTTCLIEDIAFHIENLPEATADLSDLLDRHGYDDSCIYGHALEGNFHFIINQAFDSDKEVQRYKDMIQDVAQMVVEKYDGSLKAEHGTGRNMAPFVKYEWGEAAFSVMQRIKKAFDPEGLLNPGVIFNDDPECYIRDFKALPVLSPAPGASEETMEAYKKINKCIECGFCEVNCVSCGLSLSSRTRIVAQREMARLQALGDAESQARLKELRKQYVYLGEKTCAGDGLCSTSCPMGINVADMTHELRRSGAASATWAFAADHFALTKNGIRAVLGMAYVGQTVLGTEAMSATCRGLHKLGIPLWTPSMPRAYRIPKNLELVSNEPLKVVYFPSCFNQMMGLPKGSEKKRALVEETVDLLKKAGYDVIFPENKDSLCCGTIWESKGMPDLAEKKLRELEDALWEASEHGRWPVLCDQSPCLHRMKLGISKMKLYEPAEFIWKFLRDRLEFVQTSEPVAIHTTCSTRLMKLDGTLLNLAKLCSSNVIVPEGVGCCGFAGDKGMTNPELNKHALRKLRPQLEKAGVKYGYSNSRTCEIGLATNSGIPYISIVYLVNEHTKSLR